jgi:glycogen(starch) synthase
LKQKEAKREIVVFFWVPTGIRGIKPEIIENKTLFKDIEDHLKDNTEHVMWHLLSTLVAEKQITRDTIFDKEFLAEIKRKVLRFKRDSGTPPACTHDIVEAHDPILSELWKQGLRNTADDKVKVIFYPIYLNGADGILDLNYYEVMQGSHLGVFPSFYEPWGYTPLEAGALGVSSITSDLAGFGQYISHVRKGEQEGIYVIERMDRSDDEVVESLFNLLYFYSLLPKNKRVENKFEARKLANLADWELLIENYLDAQDTAIERVFGV